MDKRLVGWTITREKKYYNRKTRLFSEKFTPPCLFESHEIAEVDTITPNLKGSQSQAIYVNED